MLVGLILTVEVVSAAAITMTRIIEDNFKIVNGRLVGDGMVLT